MTAKRLPSQVDGTPNLFDRFADRADAFVSKAWFFAVCVALVVVWAPSIVLFGDVDTWQLVINTATTIVTFLLVALIQNTQHRANDATQHKLNAIALALAALLSDPAAAPDAAREARRELHAAIGVEAQEHTS